MDREELIEYITSRVIDELSRGENLEKGHGKKQILLVIEKGKAEESIEINSELEGIEAAYHYIDIEGKFKPWHGSSFKKISNIESLKGYGLVIIYNPTLSSLSKTAHLIPEGLVPGLIIKSIEEDKPIIVVIDGLKKMTRAGSGGAQPFRGKIQELMSTLSSYGLNLIGAGQIRKEIEKICASGFNSSFSREIITRDDIVLAYQEGQKKIILKKDAIITPLAREEAQRYGIEVIRL